jgi:hypothetical protein
MPKKFYKIDHFGFSLFRYNFFGKAKCYEFTFAQILAYIMTIPSGVLTGTHFKGRLHVLPTKTVSDKHSCLRW